MDTTVLQQFLDEGMLDIGDDDSRFDALAKTSEALFEKLTHDLAALAQHTLVALDPDIPPDEPTLQQVEELAKAHWKTIRNRSSERLRQILRAVILNTLDNFTDEHPKQVAIIWLTGSSYLPFMRSSLDQSVEHNVIAKMGESAEKISMSDWSAVPEMDSMEFDASEIELPELVLPLIDHERLTLLLEAASGPQRQNNQTFPDGMIPNAYWSSTNGSWSYQFAPKAATGIALVIDEVNQDFKENLTEYLENLRSAVNDYINKGKSSLEQITRQVVQFSVSKSQRTDLLWWKETLYSPKLKQGYRSLSLPIAMLAMALDLSYQVTPFYPASVDFFLREVTQELLANSNELKNIDKALIPFADLFMQLQAETNRQMVTQLLNIEDTKPGRISLVSYLRAFILAKNETIENLPQRVGISGDQEITLPDFAVWCFRTFQAEQLIVSKAS